MTCNPTSGRGRRRVHAFRGLVIHGVVFFLVNLALVTINLATTPTCLWFFWPLLGWGIGLGSHAAAVLLGGCHARYHKWEADFLDIMEGRGQGVYD